MHDPISIANYWDYAMQLVGFHDGTDYIIYWTNFLNNNSKVFCLIDKHQMIHGLIAGMIVTDFMGSSIGWLLHFHIDPGFRKKYAIFAHLIKNLQQFFYDQKCDKIVIEVGVYLERYSKIRELLLKRGYTHKISLYEKKGVEL